MKPLNGDQQLRSIYLSHSVTLQALKPKSSPRRRGLDASTDRGLTERVEKCFCLTPSLQKLALSESPQAEVQALPPVSGVIGFVVGGIVLRSTQSLCRRKLDRT